MKIKQNLYITLEPEYSKTIEEFDGEEGSCFGKIVIDDFYEHFYMSPQVWTMKQYQEQWNLALERLKTHDTSCFVANYQTNNNIIVLWPIYKNKITKTLHIRNQIIFEEYYDALVGNKKLQPHEIFNIIPPKDNKLDPLGNIIIEEEPLDELDKLIQNRGPSEWIIDYED